MGGSFSTTAGAGFTADNAAGTATLDVNVAGIGNYNIIYTFTDGKGGTKDSTVSVLK